MSDPYIFDGMTNEIKKESQLRKEAKANTVDPNSPGQILKHIHQNSNSIDTKIIKGMIKYGEADENDFSVSYDPTTKLYTNKKRDIAFKDYNSASSWNQSIGVKREPIKSPKPFNSLDRSTYPSNQKNVISTYDLVLGDAKKNPNDPNSKEFKRMLHRKYNNPKSREWMGDDELKLIGKHKSQIPGPISVVQVPKEVVPEVRINEPIKQEKPLEQIIKEKADERLRQEQNAWDKSYGNQGLAWLKRPI